MVQHADYRKNKIVLISPYIQCLYLMDSEVACVLISSQTQVRPQMMLDSD